MSHSLQLPPEAPEPPVTKRRWNVSIVWLVPAVAVLIGLAMLVHTWIATGPVITIRFHTAEGLIAGKTPVKYKDVTVGTVSSVELTKDGSAVIATVKLAETARSLATAETRFWVVRPRFGAGGLSGIDTLLSGAYIAVDKGAYTQSQTSFIGLETPPTIINGTPGSRFILHADDLGSLDVNSPVYYRRIQVGRIASYQLDDDGHGVTLQVFVDAPYDRFVTGDTRFWNASGIDIALNAAGLKVNTQSLATVVAGGIAFATPPAGTGDLGPRPVFYVLAQNQLTALEPPSGPAQRFVLRFQQSLRGLSVGAPVYFVGVEVGEVVSVDLDYDPSTYHFPTVVGVEIFPLKMGGVVQKIDRMQGTSEEQTTRFLSELVRHGLRAQARSGSLLTGQLLISLDFVLNAPKVSFDPTAHPLSLPTVASGIDRLEDQVTSILGKVDKMPLEQIGRDLDSSLSGFDQTLKQINGHVLPEATSTLEQAKTMFGQTQSVLSEDAPLQQDLTQTLDEVRGAARSLRTLTDLLGRHPESLLRGIQNESGSSQATDH
jgi:paraquat-inducible protein B